MSSQEGAEQKNEVQVPKVMRAVAVAMDKEHQRFVSTDSAENMYLEEIPTPSAGPGQLLIRVHYAGLNRADILQRKGNYPPPKGASETIGLEVAGTVVEIGSDCSGKWTIGQRVMCLLGGGGYTDYAVADEGCCIVIPDILSMKLAASVMETWLTAFQLLHLVGHVQKGEYVVIHAGASGVGTAAIQLCRLAGAVPIVTVGTNEKIKYCQELGAVHGVNRKTCEGKWAASVVEFVKEHSKGRQEGVDIVLDCVGASYAMENITALARDGRWVLFGLMGGRILNDFNMGNFLWKRISLLPSTLRTRTVRYKAELVSRFAEEALPYFAVNDQSEQKGSAKGTVALKAVVDSVFDLAEVVQAHQRMEGNLNRGKILLECFENEEEQ